MFFRHKQTLPELKLYHNNKIIYQGYLKDVPLKESVILAKSVEFFDDPEPCHIHRSAVRTRLTAEIQKEFSQTGVLSQPGPLLLSYTDFDTIDQCVLADEEIQKKSKK